MKLIIELPEEDYIRIKETGVIGKVDVFKRAIRNGIVLPKGHGRLIDADKLKPQTTYFGISDIPVEVVKCSTIRNAPTIIKADKELEKC